MASGADEAEVDHDVPAAEEATEHEPECSLIETTVPRLQYKDSKKKWTITESEFVHVSDVTYVKLPQGGVNLGFPRLCADYMYKNEQIPEKFSLGTSIGYELIKDLRNKAQSADLMQARLKKRA